MGFSVYELAACDTVVWLSLGAGQFRRLTFGELDKLRRFGLRTPVLETPALPQTFGEILRQGSGKGQQVSDYIKHIMAVRQSSDTPLSTTCTDALNRFLNNADNTLKGILASFIAPLSAWGNTVIDKATSENDFDLRDVRKQKMTIYLHIPAGEIMQASFILNLFFSQLINENVKELPEQNPALKYQCLLLLDEFTAMGKVAIIAKGVGYMAGYNMRLAIIIQDKTQLESVYGREDAHNIVSNMGAVIYFTPSQVKEAEEYSKMIGYETVTSYSKQHSNIGALNKGNYNVSETENNSQRALMLPQELLSMSKDIELVVRSGIPVIKAGKIRYFEDEYFKERFNAVPMKEINIGGEIRKVPVPSILPPMHWRSYRALIRTSDYYLNQDFSDLCETNLAEMGTDALLDIVNNENSNVSEATMDAACMALAQDFLTMYEQDHSDAAPATSEEYLSQFT